MTKTERLQEQIEELQEQIEDKELDLKFKENKAEMIRLVSSWDLYPKELEDMLEKVKKKRAENMKRLASWSFFRENITKMVDNINKYEMAEESLRIMEYVNTLVFDIILERSEHTPELMNGILMNDHMKARAFETMTKRS